MAKGQSLGVGSLRVGPGAEIAMRDSQRFRWLFFTMLGLWAGASPGLASSFVERLSPPTLSRGKTIRVTLVGSELRGATGLWTSLPAKTIEAALVEPSRDDRAVFDVKVHPDSPLGIYGLRLATASGLSNVKLFLIDNLPTIEERESNPRERVPQQLSLPVAVIGNAGEADVDRYSMDVEAGQRLTFEVVGNRLGQDVDPVLTIRDAKGRIVVDRDNDVGLMFDCRFAHTFQAAGTYTIELRDTRFRGSDHLVYVLRIGRFPEQRVVLPSTVRPGDSLALSLGGDADSSVPVSIPKNIAPGSFYQELRRVGDQASVWVPLRISSYANSIEKEPNESPAAASIVEVPCVLHGAINSPADRDAFAFELASGQRLTAHVECRPLGSPADLDVILTDPTGKAIKRVDTLPDGEATFEIEAKSKGRHVLLVRSLSGEGGSGYVYRITIAPRKPTVHVVSDASSLAIPRGSYQPLPLSLTRTDYGGPIALELRGAPDGMALRTDAFRPGETELDNAISVADSVPEGIYTIQVVARMETNDRERIVTATTLPLIDRLPMGRGPHGEPFELREDQRRLPPTLTDQIAILVTPPSPYTFELPDRLVVLPRYLEATFRLETTRAAGFDEPITFAARGGTLEPLNLQKPRVTAEIPRATRNESTVTGTLHSGVNSELRKHRVTITSHTMHDGRAVDLTRTIDLQTQVAYEPSAEPQRLEIAAGEAATVSLRANRLAPFSGLITVRPSGPAGWDLPSKVEVAEGVDGADLKIVAPPGTKPGAYRIALPGSARVSKFDEPVGGKPLDIVVVEPKGGRS
jgi:hypothetical protein